MTSPERSDGLHWRHELHELCQPLTRLQWRLEIGRHAGDEAALREIVDGGLEDAREMAAWVGRMRAMLARVEKQESLEGAR
jgi:hypothetical protein